MGKNKIGKILDEMKVHSQKEFRRELKAEKNFWKKLVLIHWHLFMWNGLYFIVSIAPVAIYLLFKTAYDQLKK